jgi:hypothetical protein
MEVVLLRLWGSKSGEFDFNLTAPIPTRLCRHVVVVAIVSYAAAATSSGGGGGPRDTSQHTCRGTIHGTYHPRHTGPRCPVP